MQRYFLVFRYVLLLQHDVSLKKKKMLYIIKYYYRIRLKNSCIFLLKRDWSQQIKKKISTLQNYVSVVDEWFIDMINIQIAVYKHKNII